MASPRRPATPPRRVAPRRRKTASDGVDPPAAEFVEAARYRAIVEQSHDLLMVVGSDQRVLLCNRAFERTLGYSVESLMGAAFPALVHEDDLPGLLEAIRAIDDNPGAAAAVDFRVRAADGSWHFMETSATNLVEDRAVRGVVVSLRDMTEKVLVAGALKTSEERYKDLIDRAQEVVFTATLEGAFTSVNKVATVLTGYSTSELLSMGLFDLVMPDQLERAGEVLAHVGLGSQETVELQLRAKDGRRLFAQASVHVVSRGGKPAHIEGIARDVTGQRELEDRLRHEAIHDALTSLPNRTLLLDRLGLALARRNGHRKVVAMLLDIDAFKQVNDELGHAVGDGVLVELALRLRSMMREGETVARFGGDEFAFVAETTRGEAALAALAERVLSAFAEPFAVAGVPRKLTGSLGVAVAQHGSTPAELLRDADTAMYRAKAAQNGGFAFFDSAMRDQLLRQNALKEALADALANNGLRVHYQPVVSLTNDTILAVEALIRWRHPQLGPVAPDDFIPLAEENGMIVAVGRYVLGEAARQTAQWRNRYPDALPLGVLVNVSPRELAERAFVDHVGKALAVYGLKPSDLAFELTERAFIDTDDAGIMGNLNALTAMGIRLILDDFGTGYSALATLNRLPFAALKIDRTFISTIDSPDSHVPITRAIVALGQSLGISVIAEGIETDIQLEYLRNLGCTAAQGYLTGRPQSAPDVSALIGARARPNSHSGGAS